jgi:hypothetical protein
MSPAAGSCGRRLGVNGASAGRGVAISEGSGGMRVGVAGGMAVGCAGGRVGGSDVGLAYVTGGCIPAGAGVGRDAGR